MMRKRVGVFIGAMALLMGACTKEPLPELPDSNSPIYKLNGEMDGEVLDMALGEGDVTVNFGIGDENGMPTHFGEMESINSGERIRVEFVCNEQPRMGQGYNVLSSENVPFLVHEKGRIKFDFGGVGNQNNFLMLKDKNGNFVSTDILEISEYGSVNVSAIIYDYGNTTFEFSLKHGYDENNLVSRFTVEGNGNVIYLQAEGDNITDEWYINNELVGTEAVFVGDLDDGVHKIEHRVSDIDGNSAASNGLIRFKGGKRFWNMETKYLSDLSFEPYNYGRVIVSIFKDDEWFTSDFAVSNKNTEMKITNTKVIPNDSKNQPLIGFDLDFSANLMNQSRTDSISLSDVTGRFCVGLK